MSEESQALFKLAPKIIWWPTGDEAVIVMRGFEQTSAFTKIIGVIDGTHISIDAPKENANDYINRKGYHSIQLQVVCDHRSLITHCYAGHPGSIHDQREFRRSEAAEFLNTDEEFPFESHLIGDATYEIHPHLLIPFKDNEHLRARQKNFNYRLSSARTVVERCFALLKGRLCSLLDHLSMTRVDLMAVYTVACCTVHNICILQGDKFAVLATERRELVDIVPNAEPFDNRNRIHGIHKRNFLMETLPTVD